MTELETLRADNARLTTQRDDLFHRLKNEQHKAINATTRGCRECREEISRVEAERAALMQALAQHHDWHMEIGTVLLPTENGSIELDLTDSYSESSLYEETSVALSFPAAPAGRTDTERLESVFSRLITIDTITGERCLRIAHFGTDSKGNSFKGQSNRAALNAAMDAVAPTEGEE